MNSSAEWDMVAPDGSIHITRDEGVHAFALYDAIDWDEVETGLPAGATDTDGNLIDRKNRHIQRWIMATCVLDKRHGTEAADKANEMLGTNPYFSQLVDMMLDVFRTYKCMNGEH